jgi:hypothetical protein
VNHCPRREFIKIRHLHHDSALDPTFLPSSHLVGSSTVLRCFSNSLRVGFMSRRVAYTSILVPRVTCNSLPNSSWSFWSCCLTIVMTPLNCAPIVSVVVSSTSLRASFMSLIFLFKSFSFLVLFIGCYITFFLQFVIRRQLVWLALTLFKYSKTACNAGPILVLNFHTICNVSRMLE